ncbi:uncharacterized protein LOC8042164 isoform X2 [Ixodes scapularis]|uniref:uncharacterized protein LOC8042164 isoform X2 n=1 Tax=Ixodes scapularis TaxID=6945 RepID=UPI001C37F579|nr:uncharacterized protein LOC8042164 isoform X2 [Ixodes scapularis]
MSSENAPDLIEVLAYRREPPPSRVYEVLDSDDSESSSDESSDDCIVELHRTAPRPLTENDANKLKVVYDSRMQQRPLLKSLAECHVAGDASKEAGCAHPGSVTALKLVSWNIDGLNDKEIQARTLSICNALNGRHLMVFHWC